MSDQGHGGHGGHGGNDYGRCGSCGGTGSLYERVFVDAVDDRGNPVVSAEVVRKQCIICGGNGLWTGDR